MKSSFWLRFRLLTLVNAVSIALIVELQAPLLISCADGRQRNIHAAIRDQLNPHVVSGCITSSHEGPLRGLVHLNQLSQMFGNGSKGSDARTNRVDP